MTEVVPLLGELLHEEALFRLTGVRKVGVPRGRLFPSGLCLSAISRVVRTWPDPLPTRLKRVGKNVQTLWWAELDRLHSMTRAHPPLALIYTVKAINKFNKPLGTFVTVPDKRDHFRQYFKIELFALKCRVA